MGKLLHHVCSEMRLEIPEEEYQSQECRNGKQRSQEAVLQNAVPDVLTVQAHGATSLAAGQFAAGPPASLRESCPIAAAQETAVTNGLRLTDGAR